MTRRALVLGCILCGSIIWQDSAFGDLVELRNDTIIVRLDSDALGAIRQFMDVASGKNFVANKGRAVPLYSLTLTDKAGKKTTVSSTEAQKMDLAQTRSAGNEVSLTFTHTEPSLIVRVGVRVPARGALSYWRLEVENHSLLAIIGADFPGFATPQVLGSQPDDTCVIFPRATYSQRFWNLPEEFRYLRQVLAARAIKSGKPGTTRPHWPIVLGTDLVPDVVQMMACYDSQAGFYLATHDPHPNVKKLAIEGVDDATMRLSIEHIHPYEFGRDFTIDYDTVVGVFHGDWTAAAEIYRDWATQQRWCTQGTLAKGKDTPEWVTRHPVYLRMVLEHPYAGKVGRIAWKDVPEVLEQFKRAYPDLYDNAIVHFVDFDKGGFWQGFYNERWPAWMGDDVFAAEIRRENSLGLRPCIEPFGWVMAKDGGPHRPDYEINKQEFYTDIHKNTLVWSEQELLHDSVIPPGHPRACLASDYGRSVFVDDARKTAPWGMDLFQLMETGVVHGMDCFNSAHGHPLGAGVWIYEGAYNIFEEVRNTGRKLNPDFCTDKEETAEYLIPVLDTVYLRNAQVKNMRWNGRPQFYKNNVPLFDYIYHEYLIMLDGFQADDPMTTRWCAGLAAVLGHVTGPLFGADPKGKYFQDAQSGGAWEITRQAHKACNSYARRYLVFGRVLPPPGVEFSEMRQSQQSLYLLQQCSTPGGPETTRTDFVTPTVAQSAHLSPEGGVGLCFVNVADDVVTFKLPLSKYATYLEGNATKVVVRHNGDVVSEKITDLGGSGAGLQLTIEPRALLLVTLEPTR